MKNVSFALVCVLLAGCGGGGGTSGSGAGTGAAAPAAPAPAAPAPAPTLALSSTALRTITGGTPVALTAALSTNGTVHWTLPDHAPGSLSADTGTTVKYIPATDSLGGPYYVPVTATGDGASATLTLVVTPDPGAPRATLLAGLLNAARGPGITDIPASFPHARHLAADDLGNIYVLQSDGQGPTVLRKMMLSGGYTTTLADGGTWFGAPDKNGNTARLAHPSGFAADGEGNLYVSTADDAPQPATAAILKITKDGVLSLLAGSEKPAGLVIADGAGAAAGFARPAIVGIDPERNLYVRDANDTPRKVTPAGVVTTLKTFPANLNADMNGSTYSFSAAVRGLTRKAPDGYVDIILSNRDCPQERPEDSLQAFCLGSAVADIIPLGGASIALLSDDRVVKVTLPKTLPPSFTLSATTLRTIAGGTPVVLTAESNGFGNGTVNWKLGDGAPGTLSASSGTSVTYTPPATIGAGALVPVVATDKGTSATLTLAVTPDPGPAGLTLLAGSELAARADGLGALAAFLAPAVMATDLAGNVYVQEYSAYPFATVAPGFVLRKITPGGIVTTLVRNDDAATAWFGRPDPGGNGRRTNSPSGMTVDYAGNIYVGQMRGAPRNSAGIMKITPAGALSLLAGDDDDVLLPNETADRPILTDGAGKSAHFDRAFLVGSDYDGALYVEDKANIVRKVAADGTVTTVRAVPMTLQRDMNGNMYAYNQPDRTIVRINLSNQTSVVAGTPGCTALKLGALPGCLPDDLRETIVYGGNALLLRYDNYIVKLVLPH